MSDKTPSVKRKYNKKKKGRKKQKKRRNKHPKQNKKTKMKKVTNRIRWTNKLSDWVKENHISLSDRSVPLPFESEIITLMQLTNKTKNDIIKWMDQNAFGILYRINPNFNRDRFYDNRELFNVQMTNWVLHNSESLVQRIPPYPTRLEYQSLSNDFKENKKVIQQWIRNHCKTVLISNNRINADNVRVHFEPLINKYIIANCGLLWYLQYTITSSIINKLMSIAKISQSKVIEVVTPKYIKFVLDKEFNRLDFAHRIIMDLLQLNKTINDTIATALHNDFNIEIQHVYQLQQYYKNSINMYEGKQYRHSCKLCNYYFKSARELALHAALPHGYVCKHCPLKFHHQFTRRKHVNVKHKKVCLHFDYIRFDTFNWIAIHRLKFVRNVTWLKLVIEVLGKNIVKKNTNISLRIEIHDV